MANRILVERSIADDGDKAGKGRRRSVTVNAVESPLGWLRSRGLVTLRQYDAGEQLRLDWESSSLGPQVTMSWNASGVTSGSRGSTERLNGSERTLAAKDRFEAALAAAGSGLSDILWRVVCAGEGMRDAETALNWPARAGKLVLALALDRVADHYRLPG